MLGQHCGDAKHAAWDGKPGPAVGTQLHPPNGSHSQAVCPPVHKAHEAYVCDTFTLKQVAGSQFIISSQDIS